MARKLVFVVREGALLAETKPAAGPTDRRLPVAGVIGALQRFCRAGFEVVILRTDGAEADKDDTWLVELLASQDIVVTGLKSCAHDDRCDCALPGLGLVREFVADATLDRERSLVVGASGLSLKLAENMGLTGFCLTDTGSPLDWTALAHRRLDAPRTAAVTRRTRETSIDVAVDLDDAAEPHIATGIGFFDHMLEQLGKHGAFGLKVECSGDLQVDEHHTVEDVALAIGAALRKALGDKRGIGRYGFVLPMDEANAIVSIDLSGRPYFVFEGSFKRASVGGLPTELVPHFFRSLSDALGATLHIEIRGDNDHHKIESSFKGLARTLRQAFRREGNDLPSTKGAL